MIETFAVHAGWSAPVTNAEFTVKDICGCRVAFGQVPTHSLPLITDGMSEDALFAFDIADLIGASLVVGERGALEALRGAGLAVSDKRYKESVGASSRGLLAVAMWLRNGERGLSSNAMCKAIFGLPDSAGIHHPRFPGDLRRCIQFLEATGAGDRLDKVAAMSSQWSALVGRWGDLTACLTTESNTSTLAPKTYAFMQSLLCTQAEMI
ncbi:MULTISPECIES: hypothetical protein [unclassified Paraburkholderia]|uniref:hypothetical protein n=1 Tax=unclassified Paraburkholderia TaxID=2615204 RepID=UPI002AB1C49B|nr:MULTISPECIES: hypothetical protein [unclassified Paraburkholderia]